MPRLAVVVPASEAERAHAELLHLGALDGSRRSLRKGDRVWLPVTRAVEGHRVVVADLPPREARRAPRDAVLDLLPPDLHALVPDKWEQLGDVLVLRVPDAVRPRARDVAAAFAEVLGVKCVVEDVGGVRGELREMQATILWGDDPVATHVENGVTFRFDASRLMFSSGNVAERARVATLPASGETVVDMFAGIGYFTLPLAVHARPARVVAIEKNPVAYRSLQENVALNGVADVVECWPGDNREYPAHGVADRVLMGYFPGTRAFLPMAFALLKAAGGVIHYHDTAHADSWRSELTRNVLEEARACGTVVRIQDARIVKSHSPGVVHAVLDVAMRR